MRQQLIAVLLSLPSVAMGQGNPVPFVEFSIGASYLYDPDDRYFRSAPSFPMVHLGTQPHADQPFIMGLHAGWIGGWFGSPHMDDICYWTADGGCRESFPVAGVAALTFGGRLLAPPHEGKELSLGPALIWGTEPGTTIGLLAAARIGNPPDGSGLGFTVHGVIGRLGGKTHAAARLGVGVRFW